jgi:hypothetical protein
VLTPIGLDDFDVDMQPGLREKLAAIYRKFRAVQASSQQALRTPDLVVGRVDFRALELGKCISELDRIRTCPDGQVLATTRRILGAGKTVETAAQLYEYGLGYKLYGVFAPLSN